MSVSLVLHPLVSSSNDPIVSFEVCELQPVQVLLVIAKHNIISTYVIWNNGVIERNG